MSEPKLGWDTGTVKVRKTAAQHDVFYSTGIELSAEAAKKIMDKAYPVIEENTRLKEENKRIREALEEIAKSELAKDSIKLLGDKYKDLCFLVLRQKAREALK